MGQLKCRAACCVAEGVGIPTRHILCKNDFRRKPATQWAQVHVCRNHTVCSLPLHRYAACRLCIQQQNKNNQVRGVGRGLSLLPQPHPSGRGRRLPLGHCPGSQGALLTAPQPWPASPRLCPPCRGGSIGHYRVALPRSTWPHMPHASI